MEEDKTFEVGGIVVGEEGERPEDNKSSEDSDESSDDDESSDESLEESKEESRVAVEIEQERIKRKTLAAESMRLQSQEVLEVQFLREMLEVWSGRCQWCQAKNESNEDCTSHRIETCQKANVEEIRMGVKSTEKLIRWESYSCCFGCGIPQEICPSWELKADGTGWCKAKGVGCRFKGVLVRSVISLIMAREVDRMEMVLNLMKSDRIYLGTGKVEWDKVVSWMCRKIRWGRIESNKMCWLFVKLLRCGE